MTLVFICVFFFGNGSEKTENKMNEHRFYLIAIVDVGSPVFDQFYQSILCPIILLSSPFVQPPG